MMKILKTVKVKKVDNSPLNAQLSKALDKICAQEWKNIGESRRKVETAFHNLIRDTKNSGRSGEADILKKNLSFVQKAYDGIAKELRDNQIWADYNNDEW